MISMLQLRSIFNKKFSSILLAVLTIISLLQALRLRQYFLVYELEGNLLDFILFTLGGWENPVLFTFVLTWICLSICFLLVSFSSCKVIDDLSELLVSRSKNRIHFWVSNCLTQFILSGLLFLFYATIVAVLGIFLFDISLTPSEYTFEFYNNWTNINLLTFIKIASMFISGLFAMFMIGQFILMVFSNKVKSIVFLLFVIIIGNLLYLFTDIPRIIAISFYISAVSALDSSSILSSLMLNLVISITAMIAGCMCIKKADIKN